MSVCVFLLCNVCYQLFVLVMYPAYAKWVQSHRDLPIKLNQWCNVVVSILLQLHILHLHSGHLLTSLPAKYKNPSEIEVEVLSHLVFSHLSPIRDGSSNILSPS